METIRGKIALITGAGKRNGIGFAIGKKLADRGAFVFLSDVCKDLNLPNYPRLGTYDELKELAEEIGGHAVGIDVSDRMSIANAAQIIKDRAGHLDFLVNNAGAGPAPNLLQYMDLEMWEKTLDINLNGTLLVTREMLPLMTGNGASIVNTASRAGKRARAFGGAYCVSKAGVIMLTKVFALELASQNIRVNAICPGYISTDLEDWKLTLQSQVYMKDLKEVTKLETEEVPLKKLGTPDDVADLVCFLLSDEAHYITGQAINIDGGLLTEL